MLNNSQDSAKDQQPTPEPDINYFEMNMDDLMQSIPATEESNANETGNTDQENELLARINLTLSKAENHWVFRSVSDEDGLTKAQRIFNDMVGMNTLSGQPENAAKKSVLDTIEGVTEAVVYPSQDIESKPEDIDDLWKALDSIKDDS